MALMLLPFRLGEFARPIPRRGAPAAPHLGGALLGRGRAGGGRALHRAPARRRRCSPSRMAPRACGSCARAASLVSLAFAAVLAFLVFAYRNRARAVRLADARARGRSRRGSPSARAGMLDAFIHGLRVAARPAAASRLFVALTAVYWGLNAFGMRVLALGFGFELGVAGGVRAARRARRRRDDPGRPGDGRHVPGRDRRSGSSLVRPGGGGRDARDRLRERALGGAARAGDRARALLPLLAPRRSSGASSARRARSGRGSRRRRPSTGPPATGPRVAATPRARRRGRGGALGAEPLRASPSTSSRKSASSSRSMRGEVLVERDGVAARRSGSSRFTAPPRASAAGLP